MDKKNNAGISGGNSGREGKSVQDSVGKTSIKPGNVEKVKGDVKGKHVKVDLGHMKPKGVKINDHMEQHEMGEQASSCYHMEDKD